ncbi:MAG: hypothetical protein E4G99_02090 [Anaerolineales bacterium]|nr:MAG: hypothetical protein E4G99_02090 [Anaerolineales bacterium]
MFREYADKYLKLGISVFPARSNKVPAILSWAPYQTRTATPEEIEAWSEDLGDQINIALVCGNLSNITVVDCDSEEAAEKIESLLPDQIEVPIVFTPKKGCRHYYFQFTPGLLNRARYQAGIDVRTEGGYVLAPPSQTKKTPDGKCVDGEYIWHKEYQLGKNCPPPMPAGLRDYLLSGLKGEGQVRCGEESKDRSQILVEGTRDQDLFHLALQFFKDRRPLEEIRQNILRAAAICKPPQPEKEALAKLDSALKFYMKSGKGKAKCEKADLIEEDQSTLLDCRPLSSFVCRRIEYLMQDRIPFGMVTLIVGAGGVGKSTLLTEIACRVTRGEPLPGTNKALAKGSVIYITTENQPEEVLKPRAIACGGNLDRFHYTRNALIHTSEKATQPHVFDIVKDLPALKKQVALLRDVQIAIIDPAISHVGEKMDPNSSTHVRHVMDTLSAFADEAKIALVIVAHLAKGTAEQAMYKVAGSHQWVAAARVVQAVSLAKEDNELHLLSPLKSNVYVSPLTLGFKIIKVCIQTDDLPGINIPTVRVEFEDQEIDIDVEAQFNPGNLETSQTTDAMLTLQHELHNGPRPEQAVRDVMTAKGINRGSYYNARRKLKIHTEKIGKEGGWRLWLHDHWEAYCGSKK